MVDSAVKGTSQTNGKGSPFWHAFHQSGFSEVKIRSKLTGKMQKGNCLILAQFMITHVLHKCSLFRLRFAPPISDDVKKHPKASMRVNTTWVSSTLQLPSFWNWSGQILLAAKNIFIGKNLWLRKFDSVVSFIVTPPLPCRQLAHSSSDIRQLAWCRPY